MAQTIALEHCFDAVVKVGRPLEIGDVGLGDRRIIDILGGPVSGPRVSGKVLQGGADWQIIRPNGLTELHARYTIETGDGALIFVENNGIRFGPREAIERIRRGEPVDPGLIYFRAIPRFETSAPQYRWMMESLFVCAGMRRPDAVELSFHRIG